MQNVYFISGMGADKRVFQFLDLGFCNPIFIEWTSPLPGETISQYAARLRHQITDKEPVIVGLSFGGMIAIEIAKQIPVKKLILLSSAKSEKEIPYYIRGLRYLPLHKLVTSSFLRWANQYAYRLMGIAGRSDKIIVADMFREADGRLLLWAVHQIAHWKNNVAIDNVVHIHGTADILLPYRFILADHTIEGGEHLMLMNQADTISELLKRILEEI
ncbi:MAG: alpha/beta hydrolase [Chitinophagaceae bacterium]